jgi:excinuclease UvrABC nuclease subunit
MNVVYILTSPKNRCYIIGKARVLKNRLSTYNKSAEHDVVYYKSCLTKENMDIVEKIVLDKLDKYKEKANRDRFILPTDKDLSFFTNIINKSANFLRENQF